MILFGFSSAKSGNLDPREGFSFALNGALGDFSSDNEGKVEVFEPNLFVASSRLAFHSSGSSFNMDLVLGVEEDKEEEGLLEDVVVVVVLIVGELVVVFGVDLTASFSSILFNKEECAGREEVLE